MWRPKPLVLLKLLATLLFTFVATVSAAPMWVNLTALLSEEVLSKILRLYKKVQLKGRDDLSPASFLEDLMLPTATRD